MVVCFKQKFQIFTMVYLYKKVKYMSICGIFNL